tara:strand:- start:743 stop:2032 length:1290 start_codon:yes stop_codon:yes gene_type:complete
MAFSNQIVRDNRAAASAYTDPQGVVGYIPAVSILGPNGSEGLPIAQFGAMQTVERTPVIELKSTYGLSALRDIVTVTGSGGVVHPGIDAASEFAVATTANGADSAQLDSAERGRYMPGSAGEIGIGIRLASATRTGNLKTEWGAFTDDDGFIFGLDATGFYVAVRKGATDTIIRQADFNRDTFDGTGPSGLTLNLLNGNIFQVDFTWYGYGTIIFEIVTKDLLGTQRKYKFHEFTPTLTTSVGNPNLPIRAKATNGGTAVAQTVFVAGRQYSIMGKFNPNKRANGHFRSAALGSIGTTFLPVMSFRRKTDFQSISAAVDGFDALTTGDLYWQLRVNGTLTGASYGTPADTTAVETCMEVDTSATAITGGEILNPGGIIAASVGQQRALAAESSLALDIPTTQPVTLCVRRLTGTNASLSGLVVRWREEW